MKAAKISVNRGRLILSDDDYRRIRNILESFENYYIGKGRLYEIRNNPNIYYDEYEIKNQIDSNHYLREEYRILLDKIMSDFRERLRITS